MTLTGQYMALQALLWITTVAFLSAFDWLAERRLGKKSQGYLNLRLPKFIALAIASLTAIVVLYLLNNGWISAKAAGYSPIPYFAANSYFFAVFFRELKMARTDSTPGG